MEQTYTKVLFTVYLKWKFNCFLISERAESPAMI